MKDQLAKGVVWLGTAKVIINLLALVSTLVLARLLTPEDFGLVALATTMLAIISAVTELSLASALIHHRNPTETHFHTAWTLNLVRATVIALLFCAVAPITANFYHEPRLLNIMFALGLSVFMMGFNNPKTVMFTRNLIFRQEFALSVSQKIAGFIVGVIVAIIYKSYWALIAGTLASQLAGIIASYLIIPFKPKFSISKAKELWSFSIWLTLGQLVNTLNWKLDHFLIGTYLGRTALGYYSVGDNLAGMPNREIIAPLQATLFPGFSKITNDKERLKTAYRSAQSFISAIALPTGIGCALIAHPLVLLGMGEKWLSAIVVIQVLSCVFALQTLSSPVQPLAMAKGETKLLFRRDLLGLIIRIPIILVGMYLNGILGIIYARAISGTVTMIINMHLVRYLIGTSVRQQLAANARSFASVLIMAAGVLWLEYLLGRDGESLVLVIKIAIFSLSGAVIYSASHFILWIIAKKPIGPETELIKMLGKLIAKVRAKLA